MRVTRSCSGTPAGLVAGAPAGEQLEGELGERVGQRHRAARRAAQHGPEEEVGRARQDLERGALEGKEALDPARGAVLEAHDVGMGRQAPDQVRAQGDAAEARGVVEEERDPRPRRPATRSSGTGPRRSSAPGSSPATGRARSRPRGPPRPRGSARPRAARRTRRRPAPPAAVPCAGRRRRGPAASRLRRGSGSRRWTPARGSRGSRVSA